MYVFELELIAQLFRELMDSYTKFSVNEIVMGTIALILLLYPLKTGNIVNPVVQIIICASLTCVGVTLALSFFGVSPFFIVLLASILSLANLVVPSVGALVGMATSAGLSTDAILTFGCLLPKTFDPWIVSVASLMGLSSLIAFKELFLYWQLIAPPIVGGFLAIQCVETDSSLIRNGVWVGLSLISVALHIRRRRINSWLERKQDLAVHSKESQIVQLMRSAKPDMPPGEFESLKEKLLSAVEGDREQVDRILFGGGLY